MTFWMLLLGLVTVLSRWPSRTCALVPDYRSSSSRQQQQTSSKLGRPNNDRALVEERHHQSVGLSLSAVTDDMPKSKNSPKWFPTRIQEDVEYPKLVKSLYVRHILVERRETAQLALEQYLTNHVQSQDPFGDTAQQLSACSATREEGGKIGWMDIHTERNHEATKMQDDSILPRDVFQQLIDLAPKAGDVHILESSTTGQVHVVRVEELMIQHNANLFPQEGKVQRIGSHQGRNAVLPRRKLKGQGVMPEFPQLFATTTKKQYWIQTNGCQMNVADSERLAGILQHELKLQPAITANDADVVIFNTCSIRDHAEQKLYDILGPYCARKRKGDELALIVTGCVAQQEGEALLRRIPEVDVVLGPQYTPFLKNVLESVEWGHQVVVTAPMLQKEDDDFAKPIRGHTVRGWVNVIHGCNEHCTYCVVPATRGMEQSRSMESILQECLDLVAQNYKEITLLGQNIDAYGRDMVPKRTFAELLEYLNANLPDKMRIRYVTSHPRYFSDRVIDAVANLDKVCECFHMPFQAGDDEVLRKMRRGYTFESYMKIIDKIRAKSPDAAICGDVIVGFPGETDEAFERTLELMERVKFDNLNTFAYSPRPNTEAATWEDQQVPEAVKNERLQRVQQLANKHGLERSERYLDRVVEVLVEDKNPRSPHQVMGRTRQGRQVYFDGDIENLQGELVDVRITEAGTWSLIGTIED